MAKEAEKTAKAYTKTQIVTEIAESTQLTKKDVVAVLDALGGVIEKSLGKKGPGSFILPGLLKIEKKKVKAQPARKHVLNPFSKSEEDKYRDIPAKPAHNKIKVRALKSLKEMV
ncbi:MAG: HU family DNA-binding protein [Planctomycetaceae bacterium]|jgi:nucleoid DNA-binding protein|nr:HU family DNA-binding protein [Planctomycetaceae bacterium]